MSEDQPIHDRKIRFGLVGCGRISRNHFQSIEEHKADCELVAVCDTDERALQVAAKEHNAVAYRELRDLLSDDKVDVVVLCTPSGLHAGQAIEALKAGKHVVSEKPMATRWEDGLKMVRAASKANRSLFVVKQNRLNPTLQMLKRSIDEGRFGRIFMVNANVFWTRPQSYYDQAPWRGTWALDGGAFMNQASHYVDLLIWLFGPVERVHAMTATLARNIEAEDTGVVNLKWTGGTLGSMNVTMLTYPKNLEGSITVIGEYGTARVGGLAVNEIQHWEFARAHPMDEKIKSATYETTSVYGIGHPMFYDNVIKALRGKDRAISDGLEGLKSLELLAAIYRSAQADQAVKLPLERPE
jgi:UDP-N-acetyl-2-amino-2-deoxyglucuronate dehydrogenase